MKSSSKSILARAFATCTEKDFEFERNDGSGDRCDVACALAGSAANAAVIGIFAGEGGRAKMF